MPLSTRGGPNGRRICTWMPRHRQASSRIDPVGGSRSRRGCFRWPATQGVRAGTYPKGHSDAKGRHGRDNLGFGRPSCHTPTVATENRFRTLPFTIQKAERQSGRARACGIDRGANVKLTVADDGEMTVKRPVAAAGTATTTYSLRWHPTAWLPRRPRRLDRRRKGARLGEIDGIQPTRGFSCVRTGTERVRNSGVGHGAGQASLRPNMRKFRTSTN